MVWGVTALLAGVLYGYLTTGREDKFHLLWRGTLIGAVLAVVFTLVGVFTGYDALGFGLGFGLFITIIVLTVLFLLGAWMGDIIEAHVEAKPPRASR